eukprot:c33483_g1_i1 orf=134-406(+)
MSFLSKDILLSFLNNVAAPQVDVQKVGDASICINLAKAISPCSIPSLWCARPCSGNFAQTVSKSQEPLHQLLFTTNLTFPKIMNKQNLEA